MASKKASLYDKPRGESGEAEPKKVTPKEEHPKSHEEKGGSGPDLPKDGGKVEGEKNKEEHGETKPAGEDMMGRHAKERMALHEAHEMQRRDLHGQHRAEHRQMSERHEKAHKELENAK